MIKPSTITKAAHTHIEKKLLTLAKQHGIHILLAVESGSRAWGFPSQNSDYDVRFIYARNINDYLSVEPIRDVIESPLVDDLVLNVALDINGWDIRKALRLAMKSSAVLVEWLRSPIRYTENKNAPLFLQQFSVSCANLQSFAYHYDRLARNAWDQIIENEGNPKLKLYFYALRPALALEWIRQFSEIPPMDIYSLCKRLELNQKLVVEISNLITIKSSTNESSLKPRTDLLDEFIKSVLVNKIERPPRDIHLEKMKLIANRLFRNLVA